MEKNDNGSLVKSELTIDPSSSMADALERLEKAGTKCLVVADEGGVLLGTLSDGDLRRGILNRLGVDEAIEGIFNKNPTYVAAGEYDEKELREKFITEMLTVMPVIDKAGRIDEIILWDDVFVKKDQITSAVSSVPVVIMAGGKGTRLEPFTKILPKPLLPVHGKPIIERIIDRFVEAGVDEFYLSVNYKSRILKAYFEELNPGYSIRFIEEERELGTAGAIRFLRDKLEKSFFVTNCDVIIQSDYFDMYSFHQDGGYDITLAASMKNFTIPYGACVINDLGELEDIREKPRYHILANSGLYILSPRVPALLSEGESCDMTDLIRRVKEKEGSVGVYPISEEAWLDVGQWAEYGKVIENFAEEKSE